MSGPIRGRAWLIDSEQTCRAFEMKKEVPDLDAGESTLGNTGCVQGVVTMPTTRHL